MHAPIQPSPPLRSRTHPSPQRSSPARLGALSPPCPPPSLRPFPHRVTHHVIPGPLSVPLDYLAFPKALCKWDHIACALFSEGAAGLASSAPQGRLEISFSPCVLNGYTSGVLQRCHLPLEKTLTSKERRFAGEPPRRSFFHSCSFGSRVSVCMSDGSVSFSG